MKKLLFCNAGIVLVLLTLLCNACDKKDSKVPVSFPEPNAKGLKISCWVGANETKVVLWINDYVILDEYDLEYYQYKDGELGNLAISYMPFSIETVDQILSNWWDISMDKLKNEENYMIIYNNKNNYKYFAFDNGCVYLFNRTSNKNY